MQDFWRLEKGVNTATLYSARRMPHSSTRGPMDGARRALRTAIESIEAVEGHILEGVYSSKADGFFDVENVVFYNLETATFRNAAQHGLRARRSRSHLAASQSEFQHVLDYRLIPTPPVPPRPLTHLQFEPTSFRSVFDVWFAAGGGSAASARPGSGAYGLYVTLGNMQRNPAGKMKILFDGIIAALQGDVAPDGAAVERLSRKHSVDASLIQLRLLHPIASAIPPSRSARLVRPYRDGVQWHPADDLCEECTLIITNEPTALCNAYIYDLP